MKTKKEAETTVEEEKGEWVKDMAKEKRGREKRRSGLVGRGREGRKGR